MQVFRDKSDVRIELDPTEQFRIWSDLRRYQVSSVYVFNNGTIGLSCDGSTGPGPFGPNYFRNYSDVKKAQRHMPEAVKEKVQELQAQLDNQ